MTGAAENQTPMEVIQRDLTIARRDIKNLQFQVKSLNPDVMRSSLEASKEATKQVSKIAQTAILKLTVATEVSFMLRKVCINGDADMLSSTLIRAFDEDDDWWSFRREMTLNRWIETLTVKRLEYERLDADPKQVTLRDANRAKKGRMNAKKARDARGRA